MTTALVISAINEWKIGYRFSISTSLLFDFGVNFNIPVAKIDNLFFVFFSLLNFSSENVLLTAHLSFYSPQNFFCFQFYWLSATFRPNWNFYYFLRL